MDADSFGREPHTTLEQIEFLDADVRARIEFGRECEVRAQMVGADCQAHARSTTLAEQLRHSVITCTKFVTYNAFEEKKIVITCNKFIFFTAF
jgi:hypothetical protein